jgi:hypothetical protein
MLRNKRTVNGERGELFKNVCVRRAMLVTALLEVMKMIR